MRDGEAANIIAVEEVPTDRVHMYGVVGVGKHASGKTLRDHAMVEKPKREDAPSNLSSPAATSCSRKFSTFWQISRRGAGGEIQLTDAMITLAKTQPFYGVKFEGRATIAARSSASSPPMSPMR